MTTATAMPSLDTVFAAAEALLPSGWVLQANVWRPEDWRPDETPARYTAAAGPNEGPEEAWVVGAGNTWAEAVGALTLVLAGRKGA